MDGKIILDGISAAGLIAAITEIVREELKSAKPETEELMTREETAEYLSCGLSTISRWVAEGRLVCYGIGGRKYFKKAEVMNALEVLEIHKL